MSKPSKKPEYSQLVNLSFNQFKNNLVLIVPTFILLLFAFAFIILLFLQIGGFFLLFKNIILANDIWLLLGNSKAILYCAIMLIIDIVLLFIIESYVKSMQISLFRDVAQNKPVEDVNLFKKGKEFFVKYLEINLILFTLIVVPCLIAGLLFLWLYGVSMVSMFSLTWIIVLLLFALFSLITLIYVLILKYNLLFLEPIIATTKLSPLNTIKYTIKYSLKNKKNVFLTWIFICIILLVLFFISMIIFEFPILLLQKSSGILAVVLVFLFQGVRTLINLVVGITISLFKFNSFFTKKD